MPASKPKTAVGFGTPFEEQINFLRAKLRLPTQAWDEIVGRAHDRAFVVAGAANADLLADLHAAIVDAAKTGKGLDAFRRDFQAIVAKNGWTGWTGSDTAAGTAWRTRVIYQTNMATSYAAGRYQQLTEPGFAKLRPYWRYLHSDNVAHPRPQHVAWHGLTLLATDEFWQTHYPPNGWGCHCRVTAVSKAQGEASARAGLGDPPQGWNKIDPKTGAPVGIDKGFAYAPGATWYPNLDKYPFELARQVLGANMQDGVFTRWHQRIAERVAELAEQPDYKDLAPLDAARALRKAIAADEAYPVAVLPPNVVSAMGVDTQVVLLSDYDLIKQQVSRAGQEFGAIDYLNTQGALDAPRLVVRASEQMTVFVSDPSGKWYAAVLQQTADKKEIYLKSFRRAREREAAMLAKRGEVLIDSR